jgi:hypothetical protein
MFEEAALATGSNTSKAEAKTRIVPLLVFLIVVLLGGLLYQNLGHYLAAITGVTVDIINFTPSPMLDVVFEYPGGKAVSARIDPRRQLGHSIPNLNEFEGTLSFKNEQGNAFKEKVSVHAYNGMMLLLEVHPLLEAATIKTADGKEEKVIKASFSKVSVEQSYQRPGY